MAEALRFGLPDLLYGDESSLVNHALGFGKGDLNPHWFEYPSLQMYVLFAIYALVFAAGRLTGAWQSHPRLGVLSTFTAARAADLAATVPLCRHMAGDGWHFEELPTWHWPMFSRPAELAAILHRNWPAS